MGRSLALLLLAACTAAQNPPPRAPGSRGLRASEHLDAARQHDDAAKQAAVWPDTRVDDGTGRVDQLLVGMPWRRQWDSPGMHEQIASEHRALAAQLHADYERACGTRSAAEASTSPIARYGLGGTTIDHGVVIFLDPAAGPPDKLIADIECHRAWMMLAPADMDTCPLDLAGIHVDAMGDELGITLHLTAKNPELVPELQRRAEQQLEQHKTR